ncbi:hypothetical protein SCLCIDRAFT_117537, partial [Scleroderma citrinum Foug A]
LIFYWVFVPWLQCELDAYKDCVNNTAKCCDCNKILPHGVPELVYTSPEDYGALDFKVCIYCEAIEHVCKLYIDPTHAVLISWLRPLIHSWKCVTYTSLQCPPVGHNTAWMVYLNILDCVHHHEEAQTLQQRISTINLSVYEDEALPLINGLHDLPFDETEGNYYMGGVGSGLGLCKFCTSNVSNCPLIH